MQVINFGDLPNPTTAILIKESSFKKSCLIEYYVGNLVSAGIDLNTVVAYSLEYPTAKVSAKNAKLYLETLLPTLDEEGITTLYVADAEYFKALTGEKKAEVHLNYVKYCNIPEYAHIAIVLGVNYSSLFYNPANETKLNSSLGTLVSFINNSYLPPGNDLLSRATLLYTYDEIKAALKDLLTLPQISSDIEGLSLDFWKAGISTIGFAKSETEAFSFAVSTHDGLGDPILKLLKDFFIHYKGKIIWHNASYDLKVIIYELFMKDPLDQKGMYEGVEIMTRNFDDSQIIAYLALNSCVRQKYSLKILGHDFAGNYAQDDEDIKDILRIDTVPLLQYNAIDCLTTWYVYNKYLPVMIADNQQELYETLMKDSIRLLLEIELTGMPINMDKVLFAEQELLKISNEHLDVIRNSSVIKEFNLILRDQACKAKNDKLKVKVVPLSAFDDVELNPGSGKQLQQLFYEYMGLPVIDKTKKKQPATGNKTIKKLINHTQDPEYIKILEALIGWIKTDKILTSFIPAFKNAWLKADGCYYLHGNFRLGGTVSGRLSCAKPNMQQIPSGSTYAKLIKDCFSAAKGWLMAGADFSSLEDRISALTTKDPNKLKVYTDGYDGHCLRAFSYFPDRISGIVDTVESINSIEHLYPDERQLSKAPTFALTYQGTYITLMNNCGFSETLAKSIESSYHVLYQVSDAWIQDKLIEASKVGYVTVAFGLRVRTPMLKQVVYGSRSMPFEAAAEGRTAGNALGQSYGLLNNRAAIEFRERLINSPYRYCVRMIALIHDAIYLIVKDDINVVHWVNENLPSCMEWQELPEIQHPDVKLGGDLELYHPSWKYKHTLPNHATKDEILSITSQSNKP